VVQVCGKRAFPEDPENAVHDENAAAHVERVYCSHVYHHDCLIVYMKTPPFQGNLISLTAQTGFKCTGFRNYMYLYIYL